MQNPQFVQRPIMVTPVASDQDAYENVYPQFVNGPSAQQPQRQIIVNAAPQQLFYQYPSHQQQVHQQAKTSNQWKNICLVILVLAVFYINYTCFNLEAKVATRDQQINVLSQSITAMERKLAIKNGETVSTSAPVKSAKKESSCGKAKQAKQAKPMTSDARVFFEFQAASDGPSLTCNGTDVCATLGNIQNQQNQALFQIGQLNNSLLQLQVIVNQHAQDIADLQNNSNPNNTNPNVTNWSFNKDINVTGYNINQMIQLLDGRLATASIGSFGSAVLLWDINTGRLSKNLTILYSTNVLQSLVQLHDGRLLATAKNPNTNAGELQVWNVTTGTIIQRIQFSYNLISITQLAASGGSVVALTSQGNVAVFNATSLYTPFKTLLVQNPIVSTNPNQLVEFFVNMVSKLLVPVSATSIAQIDTATWTIDHNSSVGANGKISALFWSGNSVVTALGNTASHPIIVNIPAGTVNNTINTVAYSAGLVATGVLATTSSANANLNIYNIYTGELLRTITQGMVSNGYSIIPITGAVDGFAVASYNQHVISLYNY